MAADPTSAATGTSGGTASPIPVISADSHIDIGWLPADTFTSRVPAALRDRAPQIVDGPGGPQWVADGKLLSGVASVGSKGRPYSPGRWQRADRMAETGLYDDGLYRPANPDQRWRDQDRDGIVAEVLYGLFGVSVEVEDAELAAAISIAFNDWLAEFCAAHPDRYIGLACLPNHDADAAAKEVVRAAALGLPGAVIDVKNGFRPLWHGDWDPLWATAQDLDFPVSFHTSHRRADSSRGGVSSMAAPAGEAVIESAVTMSLLQFQGAADYFSIILGGALDRFPRLRIVLGESGVGWIPALLERMEWEYDNEFRSLGLELKPTEYWDRQMYATFQRDTVGMHLLQFLGEDHVMFASDYPHPDGTWPDSLAFIDEMTGHLPEPARRKILRDNAAKVYRIGQ